MPSESRTAKSIKNSTVALIMYVINLILQFYSRKIFLAYLGTEILGLNTTATNLLFRLTHSPRLSDHFKYNPIHETPQNPIII